MAISGEGVGVLDDEAVPDGCCIAGGSFDLSAKGSEDE